MRTMGVCTGVSKGNRFSPCAESLEDMIDFEKLTRFSQNSIKGHRDIEKYSFHFIDFVHFLQPQEQKKSCYSCILEEFGYTGISYFAIVQINFELENRKEKHFLGVSYYNLQVYQPLAL